MLWKVRPGLIVPSRAALDATLAAAAPLDGLSPTGAWSASRKLFTAYAGSFYSLTSSAVDTLLDQSGNSRNFSMATTTHRPVIGHTVVDGLSFDGVDDELTTVAAMSSFISTSSGYMIVSIQPTGFPSDSGTFFFNSPILQDNNQNTGITVRANGGSPLIYAGNYPNSVQSSIAANIPYVVEWRHESGTLYQRINGAGEVSVASGTSGSLTGILRMGAKTSVYQGYIFEVVIFTTVPALAIRNQLVQALGTYVGASV